MTQDCQIASSLSKKVFMTKPADKGHAPLASVLLVDCQGIFTYQRGREDGVPLPSYFVYLSPKDVVEYL